MDASELEVLVKTNPKVDRKVVDALRALEETLPESEKPKVGADYRLSPPLGGSSLLLRSSSTHSTRR